MPKTTTMLEHALDYAKLGLPVIPLHGVLDDGGCTCGAARCASPGKHPRTTHGLKDATTDPAIIDKWWSDKRWPNASIGGVCGAYMCLDIDARKDGFDSLQRLIASNSKLPDTAVVETGEYDGERGKHYWFKVPNGANPATRSNLREGIDIRGIGGFAVMPPSEHASGVSYEWIGRKTLKGAADAPAWLIELVPEYVVGDSEWTKDPNFRMSKDVRDFLNGTASPEIGEQRDFLVRAARSVLTTGRSVALTASLLWEGNDGNGGINAAEWGDIPWTPEDIYELVSDVFAKPPNTPLEKDFAGSQFTDDDAGNAKRLIASFKPEHIHFCPELDNWFVWDEEQDRYRRDGGTWMARRWISITDQLLVSAQHARSEGEQKALYKHAKESRAKWRIAAAVDLAKLIPRVSESELDPDPYLFAVANGVVDLRTGKLREAAPSDLITRGSNIEFDPDATSDLFDGFLDRSLPEEELQEFVQHACGYSLSGDTSEHAFFYVYGPPASGKSTLLEAFRRVMGSYATVASSDTFIRGQRSDGGPSEDLARLAGARLVVTHEIEEGQRLATSLVNQYVGGDSVAARFLRASTFEFKPRFKLWIGANHLPKVSGGKRSGIWRRIKIVEMNHQVPVGDRDPTLSQKLREPEAQQAILAWAVAGAVAWHKRKQQGKPIAEPAAVRQAVEQYEDESDHIERFIQDALDVTGDDKDRASVDEVFNHYLKWCANENRRRTAEQHDVANRLKDHGIETKNAVHNGSVRRCRMGIKLLNIAGAGIKLKGPTKSKTRKAKPKNRSKR